MLRQVQRIVGIEMLPDSAVGSGSSSVIHADIQYAKRPHVLAHTSIITVT